MRTFFTTIFTGVLVLLFFLSIDRLNAQIEGCTDPNANNYNPNATINDGSCTYDPAFYNPHVFFTLPALVNETSGLIFFRDGLWTFNDSNGAPELYKIDNISHEIIQTIEINDAVNVDWEDITQDDKRIYIGDFGNNNGNRDDLRIYIVEKSNIPLSENAEVDAQAIDFYYEDQKSFMKARRKNNFDCEAMISVGDSLYLFSKNWGNELTKLYVLPKTPGEYTAKLKTEFDIKGLVTGAAYNAQYEEVVLCGYKNQFWIPFVFLLFEYHDQDFFSGNKRRIDFPYIISSQTEGICFYEKKNVFISAEQTETFSQRVYKVNIGNWTDISASAVEPVISKAIDFSVHPNPVKGNTFKIDISKLPVESYTIEMFDTTGKKIFFDKFSYEGAKNSVSIRLRSKVKHDGLYIVKISSGDHYATHTIIIKDK